MAEENIITVVAPRKKPRDPDNPQGNRTVLFERDRRHPKDGDSPKGEAYLAEGDGPVRVYRTPTVVEKLSKGLLKEVPKGTAPKAALEEASKVQPDSLHTLELTEETILALEQAGVSGVAELVDRAETGKLEDIKGVGPSRAKQILAALALAGKIKDDLLDDSSEA